MIQPLVSSLFKNWGLHWVSRNGEAMRYFGVPRNGTRIGQFRQAVGRVWFRTLRRRSQKHRLTSQRMCRIAAHWLPLVHICHPYPSQRLIVTTQGRN